MASHVERSEVSVLYTGEITLVLFSLHKGNLDGGGDIEGNLPKHGEVKIDPQGLSHCSIPCPIRSLASVMTEIQAVAQNTVIRYEGSKFRKSAISIFSFLYDKSERKTMETQSFSRRTFKTDAVARNLSP